MENKISLNKHLKEANDSGSLLTPKHDPNNHAVYRTFRTVVTPSVSGSLYQLIDSEQYDVDAYYSHKHGKYFYRLLPFDSGSYATVGYGIPGGVFLISGSYDSLVVASGSFGWHAYAKDSSDFAWEISNGKTEYKGRL